MSDDNLPDKLRSLCGVIDPYAECRNRSDYRCPVCRGADELERLHGLLQPCRADTDAQIDPDYPRTVDDVLSLLSAYISDFMPEDVCPPDEYYAAWERQARTVVEPMMQRLAAAERERDELQTKYNDAAQSYAGICRTLDESGQKRTELEQRLVTAEARQFSVGAKHLRDYAERVKERDECRRLLREACDVWDAADPIPPSYAIRLAKLSTAWREAARAAGGEA